MNSLWVCGCVRVGVILGLSTWIGITSMYCISACGARMDRLLWDRVTSVDRPSVRAKVRERDKAYTHLYRIMLCETG